MDRVDGAQRFVAGADVVGADGEKLGELVAVQGEHLVVAKGFFFTTDYHVPTSAVAAVDGGVISLNVTTEEALGQGWEGGADGETAPAAGPIAPESASGAPCVGHPRADGR